MIRSVLATFFITLSFNMLCGQPYLKPDMDYIKK